MAYNPLERLPVTEGELKKYTEKLEAFRNEIVDTYTKIEELHTDILKICGCLHEIENMKQQVEALYEVTRNQVYKKTNGEYIATSNVNQYEYPFWTWVTQYENEPVKANPPD